MLFILRKEDAPVWVACNTLITLKHILTEYADLLEIRKKYFEEKSLYSLFRNVIPEMIFLFLARDCVLQNMKFVKVVFVWRVCGGLFEILCGAFCGLFGGRLGDKLKFVFSPNVILCG